LSESKSTGGPDSECMICFADYNDDTFEFVKKELKDEQI
jgi:hypothetical protein